MRKLALVACGLALVSSSVPAAELILAARGKAPAYTIVIPAKASPTQRYAAEELRDFTARMTGVTLAIATRGETLPEKAIVIDSDGEGAAATSPLGEDGFRLKVNGARLYVTASPVRGALYGVYELLECFGGCRWYSSWCDRVPARETFAVPDTLDEAQTPAFLMREPFWFDVLAHGDFAARVRCNCRSWRSIEAKYGKDHPEYFALRDGKRRNETKGEVQWYVQLCLTNPDVLKLVVEGVKARIRQDPGAKFYGVSQNDNPYYCQCEKCAAIDAEEDSHAGTVVRFVNAVAEEIEKEFPNVVIETLAYQFSRKPPKKTRLRHNVIPCLCSIECDFARPIPTSPYKDNIAFRDDIRGWSKQTDMLYVWDYTTNFRHYPHAFPNVYALQDNIRFFRDNGVKCLFEQGAYQGRHADFAELKAWLMAKWMWNPELPMKDLLDDFFNGYYGKGAPFVRAYFEELHRLQRDYSSDPKKPLCIFEDVTSPALSDEFFEKAADLWAKAAAAVKDDPVRAYNVRMGSFSVDYTRLERLRRKTNPVLVFDPAWAGEALLARRDALVKSLLARMEEAKDIRICESADRHASVPKEWREIVASKPRRAEGDRAELEESFLTICRRGDWGDFVDDPQAADGKALKLFNTHFEWCTSLQMSKIAFEPGAKYTIRVRVRVEPKAGAKGQAFWSGVYDPVGKKACGAGCCPNVTDVKPGYQWYDVMTWVPKSTDYFWIGPGFYQKNKGETTSIEGVWIDKIELVRVR